MSQTRTQCAAGAACQRMNDSFHTSRYSHSGGNVTVCMPVNTGNYSSTSRQVTQGTNSGYLDKVFASRQQQVIISGPMIGASVPIMTSRGPMMGVSVPIMTSRGPMMGGFMVRY
jgi:hypothetical protein